MTECIVCGDPTGDRRPLCESCYEERKTGEDSKSDDLRLTGSLETEAGVWPDSMAERARWGGHSGKHPYFPWVADSADRPCGKDGHDTTAECDCSAKNKWQTDDSYRPLEKAKIGVAADDYVDEVCFIHSEDDGLVFIDGDDVHDEEKGLCPEFAALGEMFGATYTDISTSGTGAHYVYEGEMPGERKSAVIQLSADPWGDNDDPPKMEIWAGKKVNVMTGRHVVDTPDEVQPLDTDALADVLRANNLFTKSGGRGRAGVGGELPDDADSLHSPDWDDYSPDATSADDQADDIKDIIYAVDHLDTFDVAEATIVHKWNDSVSTSAEARAFYPTWGRNSNGRANICTPRGWNDTGGGGYGPATTMAAIDAGLVNERHAGGVSGETWAEAVDHLRDLGFDIPDWPEDDHGHDHGPLVDRVLLPEHGSMNRHIGYNVQQDGGDTLSRDDVYQRTEQVMDRAMHQRDYVLVDGLMGVGKTYSAIKTAFERDEPAAFLSGTHNIRQQVYEYADAIGFNDDDVLTLPSFFRDCPTARGDHGDEWEALCQHLRGLGVQPKQMHALLDMPCEEHGDCEYRLGMQFDPTDYDLLIGHYAHAHLPQVVSGRHVIVDENPLGAYEETIGGEQLVTSVNRFLSFERSPPADDFEDLLAARDDAERREDIRDWFRGYQQREGWDPDHRNAVRNHNEGYHALTPHAVYTIALSEHVSDDPPLARAEVANQQPAVFRDADENQGYSVVIGTPPSEALSYSRSIIALDGTPALVGEAGNVTAPEWEQALGRPLDVRRVLDDDERETFVTDTLGNRYIQTSPYIKPYSSGNYANADKDLSLVEGAADEYGHDPSVITSKTVRRQYEGNLDDLDTDIRAQEHYGNLRGRHDLADHRLGVLLGSPHYGDEYLATRAAMLGEDIEPEGRGTDRDYGSEIGNALLESMREASVAQAAMRFGRDGAGARVLIHTAAVPDWLPVHARGSVTTTWSSAQRDAIMELNDGFVGSANDLAKRLDVGVRQTRNILHGLADSGYVDRRQDPEDGRRYEWTADEVGEAPVYGETSLPSVAAGGEDAERDRMDLSIREVSANAWADVGLSVRDYGRQEEAPQPGADEGGGAAAGAD